MRRIGFYLLIITVFLLAPLLALPQKAVPAPAAAPTPTIGTKKQLEIERFLAAFLFNTLLLILLCSRGKC